MEEEFDNKLEIQTEDGHRIVLNVLDIIDSLEFQKTFIFYTLFNDTENIFASILNESIDTYSLETISNENELRYVAGVIREMLKEEE